MSEPYHCSHLTFFHGIHEICRSIATFISRKYLQLTLGWEEMLFHYSRLFTVCFLENDRLRIKTLFKQCIVFCSPTCGNFFQIPIFINVKSTGLYDSLCQVLSRAVHTHSRTASESVASLLYIQQTP